MKRCDLIAIALAVLLGAVVVVLASRYARGRCVQRSLKRSHLYATRGPILHRAVLAHRRTHVLSNARTVSAARRADKHSGETIFVSVPEYRDPEVGHTLVSIYRRARHPARVRVGVCSQRDPDQDPSADALVYAALAEMVSARTLAPSEAESIKALHEKNTRYVIILHSDAKGPVFARSLLEEKLYRGEDYLMMVDSHAQFSPDWDVRSIDELRACPSFPKAVLSHYPEWYQRSDREGADFGARSSRLVFGSFEDASSMPMWGCHPVDPDATSPPLSAGWGACFSMAPRQAVQDVPFHNRDEYPFLFFGEEVGMAVRFFTNGYNLYAPRMNIVLTTYERDYRPLFWDNGHFRAPAEEKSRAAMRKTLGVREVRTASGRGRVGFGFLGNERSVEDYEEFSGIDLLHLKGDPEHTPKL